MSEDSDIWDELKITSLPLCVKVSVSSDRDISMWRYIKYVHLGDPGDLAEHAVWIILYISSGLGMSQEDLEDVEGGKGHLGSRVWLSCHCNQEHKWL